MGRRRICAVPVRKLVNFWPASSPVSRRIVVPELPQSSTSAGSCRPSSPRPWTTSSVGETFFDLDTQAAHDVDGGAAVAAVEKVADGADALGDARKT